MDYAILITSCDKNKPLLDVFFKYFRKYYKYDDVKIYVMMEKLNYCNAVLPELVSITFDEYKSWSDRLIRTIKQIDEKAILILLDDYLIEEPVDTACLRMLADEINKNDSIAHFALTTVPMKNDSDTIYFQRFYKRYKFGRYKTTLQAGIWNKNELLSILRASETPWQVELYGNYRSFLSNRDYYALVSQDKKPIVYNDGLFCVQGLLNENEIKRLSEKFGETIEINGLKSNNGVLVRDMTPFHKKIINRIKMIFIGSYYYVLGGGVKEWVIRKK